MAERDVRRRGAALLDRLLGLPAATAPGVDVHRGLRVPMPDGVTLLADRYVPRRADGPAPVVLLRTPYGRHRPEMRLFAGVLARRGLQVVVQNMRGVSGSGGEFRPFHDERDDGLATVAWLRERPWCDGRVATAGASYLGFAEWAIGAYLDPPLEAMGLGVTASEFVHSFYPGGALGLHNLLLWSSSIGTQKEAPLGGLLPSPLHVRRVRRAMGRLPVGEADLAAIGRPEPFLREVVGHIDDQEFWAETDHSAGVAGTTAPVSMVTGWWDLFLRRQLKDFAALRAAGREARITVGPWGHDLRALRATLLDQVSWLSAHLLDDTAQLRRAPVRVHLQNANRWLDFEHWPPRESTPTPLFLVRARELEWDAPLKDGAVKFTYDPSDPTPTTGGPLLSPAKGKQQENGAIEVRPDVVVFTGARLERDLDLVGPVSATVYVRTDPGYADVFVRLCDVDATGGSRNVTDGILRLRPGRGGQDGVVRAEVEMHPTGYRFRRGHRLRVQVAGGAFPRFARNHGRASRSPRPCGRCRSGSRCSPDRTVPRR
ncbi:CocE/NonD family hydrolase [Actinomadura xylanilytica]|uniref:CocE/NonD family hydrolase n=1 Tax=Actinomadura xylanilytica TaxID=887459 RepID=UPI00255B0B6A|nr:CocE/NonD family hydrolase [Actinomadura xylanilytica]MDL4773847.1 CocE/NonD family hydrolase [Actinomadura xylanilytica]